MSDLIDRQKAQDMLDRIAWEHPYGLIGTSGTYSWYNEGWTDAIVRAGIELQGLPSAQPGVPDINVGDNDLISRQAAIDAQGGKK